MIKLVNMSIKNISSRLLLLVAAVLCNLSALAASVVTISDVSIKPGEVKDVTISLDTEASDVYVVYGTIKLPAGLSFASEELTSTDRTAQGFTLGFNSGTGYFQIANYSQTAISGKSGAIATFKVQADENLAEESTITLSGAAVWHKVEGSDPVKETVKAINGKVTYEETPIGRVAFYFADNTVSLGPGRSVTVPVKMENEPALRGFQAKLNLPAGVTAKVNGDKRLSGTVNYNASNRTVFYHNGGADIKDNDGVLFNIVLTGAQDFAEDGTLMLSDIHVTTPEGVDVEVGTVTLTVKAKDEEAKAEADDIVDRLQQKLDNTVSDIIRNYPAAAQDKELIGEEQGIQREINALRNKVEKDYDNNTLDPLQILNIANPISAEIDALKAHAQQIQGNEDGKAALDDELAELQKKLDDAEEDIPSDIPAEAAGELADDVKAIQDQIDALKAQAEKDYKDGKLTKDSKLDPEKKQEVLDAIDELLAKIKTWLRGDVDNDGDVDMQDYFDLTDSILTEQLPTPEELNRFYRYDANADAEVNVGDMQGIVNICLGLTANGVIAYSRGTSAATLSVEKEATATGMRYTLKVQGMGFTGFQMDVEGAQVISESSALAVRKSLNGSHTRLLAMGQEQQDGTVVIETAGDASFRNIIFTTAGAETVKFDLGTTGISTVKAQQGSVKSFDLSGRSVKNGKGVVITEGKKVLVK
jgi:hypothetical protein